MNKFARSVVIFSFLIAGQNAKAGFDFGSSCDGENQGGNGQFLQAIEHWGGVNENAVTVGEIPAGITGVYISLESDADVDIRLYDKSGTRVVHWPSGLINTPYPLSASYNDVGVEYSGYNGVGGSYGHEYIRLTGTTKNAFVMKAFGYQSGFAEVNYSWEGREGNQSCGPQDHGEGSFEQQIESYAGDYENAVEVGEIPQGITNLNLFLVSDRDVDIRIYDSNDTSFSGEGKPIVHWPNGLLNSRVGQSAQYNGVGIEYSGYDGDGANKGREYIKIFGESKNDFVMKAFGYESGYATITYNWGRRTAKDLQFPSSFLTGWSHTSGSIYHNRRTYAGRKFDDSYALDLNLNSPTFDFDDGKSVKPVAKGTVIQTDDTLGFALVQHQFPLVLDDGEVLTTWYSGYMHMESVTDKKDLLSDDILGEISNEGAGNNHLHFAIYELKSGRYTSVDIKNKLTKFASPISNWY